MKPNAARPNRPIPERVAQRAIERVDRRDDGCWITHYRIGSHGYGCIGWSEDSVTYHSLVHRAAWVAYFGAIPDGMTVDHLCGTRTCANPAHLRLLSLSANSRRHKGRDWPEGYCVHGHPDSERVETVWAGKRKTYCAACLKVKNARLSAKKKAQRAAARAASRAAAARTMA